MTIAEDWGGITGQSDLSVKVSGSLAKMNTSTVDCEGTAEVMGHRNQLFCVNTDSPSQTPHSPRAND